MMLQRINRLLLVCVTFWLAGTAWGQMPNTAEIMRELESVEMIQLTEKDVTSWIAAARDISDADLGLESNLDMDKVSPSDMRQMWVGNADVARILSQHGLTPERFGNVAMNLMMAIGAAEMAKQQVDMDEALAQLEAIKGQMPQAQYDMMVAQITGVQSIFARVPPENVELAKKYEQEITRID